MTFLEVGNMDGIVLLIVLIMIGPALLFAIIGGVSLHHKNKKAAKVFFILSVVYLIISFGICGSMMM